MQDDALEAKDLLLGKNKVEVKYTDTSIRFYMRSVSRWKDKKFFKQLKKFMLSNSYNDSKIFYLNLSNDCNFAVLELNFRFSTARITALNKWKEYDEIALK